MSDYQQTKWITKNFENLKGLINIPIALYFVFLAIWNASKAGITPTGKDIGIPLIMIFLAILSMVWVSQYYSKKMGTVKTLTNTKIFGLFIVLFMLIILMDYLDLKINKELNNPVSVTSLAFAIFFAFPFFRRGQMVYLFFSILFILLAITPTIGLLPYDSLFDNRYGVWGYLLVGITMLVGGLFDHYTLKKLLPPQPGNLE
ncbi:MAG: hypothetical protein Q7U53_10495 [Anaerolineaceae bacterium]|nr:hypothetical protein [Anaerolineaceae bacterium]